MAREAEEERQILAEQTRGEREMLEKAEAAVEKIRREKNLKLQEKQQRESQWQDDKARRIMEKQGNLEAAKQEHAAERDRVLARLVALNGMGAGSGQKALADGGPSTPTRSNLGPPRNSPGSASSRGSTNLGSVRVATAAPTSARLWVRLWAISRRCSVHRRTFATGSLGTMRRQGPASAASTGGIGAAGRRGGGTESTGSGSAIPQCLIRNV